MALGSKIKGITIEFSGDTSKLGKALKQIDTQTRSLDKDLRDVDKALKFNPHNTELLAQKQSLLKDRVEETRTKLETLKQAQAKLDEDPSVDKTSREYMDLRREIITTESTMQHFIAEGKKVDKLITPLGQVADKAKEVGEKMEKVGEKISSFGESYSKYVTAPITAAGSASVVAFNEVDAGLDVITQKTGASGAALDSMKESAKNLATQIPTDFATAGAAIGEVNTRFGLTGQELEDLSGKFIQFAQLNNVDVSDAVDATQKALSAFGLDASYAGGLLDRLNQVGQQTGVSVDTLTDGLVQNGTAFQEMGLNIDQAAIAMGQMEKSGANSETVMQGLRKALKSATEQGIPLDQALLNLQDTIKNGTGSVDGLTAAYDLFGKSGDQIYGAVQNGSLDFAALAQASDDAGGSVVNTFNETLDPADKFQTTLNQLKITGSEVGETLLEMLIPVLEKLNDGLKKLNDWWTSMSPETQQMIIVIAGIVAAVGPLLVIIGKLITGVGALLTYAPALGGAFSALAGPIGIVIAAIGAAIAIGVLLYKNWDKIKAGAKALKEFVVGKFKAMKEGVIQFITGMKDGLRNILNNIGTAIRTIVSTWFDIITWPFRTAWDTISNIIDKIKDAFDFRVNLPHIKLPHFSIHPKGWQLGDLLDGVIPSLSIDWYAKGGIFTRPTVLAGVGEAGNEAVLPLSELWSQMGTFADSIVNGFITAMNMQQNGGNITIENYLYPSGAKMGEVTVQTYDKYKKILG